MGFYSWETQKIYPNSKVHGANMGPSWGRQDPGGPHVGPMNFAIWVVYFIQMDIIFQWWSSVIYYNFHNNHYTQNITYFTTPVFLLRWAQHCYNNTASVYTTNKPVVFVCISNALYIQAGCISETLCSSTIFLYTYIYWYVIINNNW